MDDRRAANDDAITPPLLGPVLGPDGSTVRDQWVDQSDEHPVPAITSGPSGWQLAFGLSLAALIAVVSFGAGMIAERSIFRNASPLDVVTGDRPFEQVQEVGRLLREEYFYRPDSDGAASSGGKKEVYGSSSVATIPATAAYSRSVANASAPSESGR